MEQVGVTRFPHQDHSQDNGRCRAPVLEGAVSKVGGDFRLVNGRFYIRPVESADIARVDKTPPQLEQKARCNGNYLKTLNRVDPEVQHSQTNENDSRSQDVDAVDDLHNGNTPGYMGELQDETTYMRASQTAYSRGSESTEDAGSITTDDTSSDTDESTMSDGIKGTSLRGQSLFSPVRSLQSDATYPEAMEVTGSSHLIKFMEEDDGIGEDDDGIRLVCRAPEPVKSVGCGGPGLGMVVVQSVSSSSSLDSLSGQSVTSSCSTETSSVDIENGSGEFSGTDAVFSTATTNTTTSDPLKSMDKSCHGDDVCRIDMRELSRHSRLSKDNDTKVMVDAADRTQLLSSRFNEVISTEAQPRLKTDDSLQYPRDGSSTLDHECLAENIAISTVDSPVFDRGGKGNTESDYGVELTSLSSLPKSPSLTKDIITADLINSRCPRDGRMEDRIDVDSDSVKHEERPGLHINDNTCPVSQISLQPGLRHDKHDRSTTPDSSAATMDQAIVPCNTDASDLSFLVNNLMATPLGKDSNAIMTDNSPMGAPTSAPPPPFIDPHNDKTKKDDNDKECQVVCASTSSLADDAMPVGAQRKVSLEIVEIHTTDTNEAAGVSTDSSAISIRLTQCEYLDGSPPVKTYINPLMLSPPAPPTGYSRERADSVISVLTLDTLEPIHDQTENDSDYEYHSTHYSNKSTRSGSIFAILEKWKCGMFQRERDDVEAGNTPTTSIVSSASAISRTNRSLFAMIDKWKSGIGQKEEVPPPHPAQDNVLDISFLMPSQHLIDENPVVLDHIEGQGYPLPGSKEDTVKQIRKKMRKQLLHSFVRNLCTYASVICCIAIIVWSIDERDFKSHLAESGHLALVVILGVTLVGFLAQIVHIVREIRGKGEKPECTVIFKMLQSAKPKEFFEQTLKKRQLLSPYLSVELQIRKGAKIVVADPNHWTQSARKTTTSLAYRGWADRSQSVHEFQWKSCGPMAYWIIVNKDFRTTTRHTLHSIEADVAEFLENTDYNEVRHFVSLNYLLDVDEGEWFPDAQAHLVFPNEQPCAFYNVLVYKVALCLGLDSLYIGLFHLFTANNNVYSIVKFVER